MNKALLALLLMSLSSAILIALAIFFFVREKNKQKNCTQKTTGTIFRYGQGNDEICLPVVEYFVDGKRYTGKRKWRVYKTVEAPWITQSGAENNVQKNTLSSRGNSSVFVNPLAESYPIGRQLDVFYNPQKPKQSYVEIIDKKPSVTGEIMLIAGIGFAALGAAMYLLLIHVR